MVVSDKNGAKIHNNQSHANNTVVNLFEDNGYSVGINYPYSNSEAPECAFGYQSMMLEVNKRVYLEGRTPYLKTHCDKKKSVREVLGLLMESVAG